MKDVFKRGKLLQLYFVTGILLLVSGCVDYGLDNIYIVENKLHQRIKVSFVIYSEPLMSDSVNALTSKNVFVSSSLCGKNFVPGKGELVFKKFEVFYKDTIKINKDFMNKDLWSFSGKEYEGTYVLVIDTTFLK